MPFLNKHVKDGEIIIDTVSLSDSIKNLSKIITNKDYLNRDEFLDEQSNKIYASWLKSHEFVAARIPSQSMQSFMPMKNVAYFNTKSNEIYVSVWQI